MDIESIISESQRIRRLIGIKEHDLFLISYDRIDKNKAEKVISDGVENFIKSIGQLVGKPVQSTIIFTSTLFLSQILEKAYNAPSS